MSTRLLATAALAVVSICAELSAQAHFERTATTLTLYGNDRAIVATINVAGTVAVQIDPAYRYQWAQDKGIGYRQGTNVTHESYEIWRSPVPSPARRMGWRNPLRLDRYIVPVWQVNPEGTEKEQAYLDVRADLEGNFLIVITVIHKASSLDEVKDRRNPK